MVKINYAELNIDHLVIFGNDHTVFACARENDNGLLRIFLYNEHTGNVYTRNGRIDSWEHLLGIDRDTVLARIDHARNTVNFPIFKVNGSGCAQN
jgi:hypothetical protein